MKSHQTMTSRCLERWNQGKSSGLTDLLERHLPWIRSRVRKRIGPRLRRMVESSDIVQDAAMQFFQYAPRFSMSDEEHFRALLARIVENVLRDKHDWFTARRRRVSLERPLPTDTVLDLDSPLAARRTPSQACEQHEKEAWVRLGIELLDPNDREVIVLRQWENLPFDEIGERLDISANAARMRNERAVGRLGKVIGSLRRGHLDRLLEQEPEQGETGQP